MEIKNLLLNWYRENLRDLPWRHNRNPYSIWLSEIILQQTQVIQGLPYYEKFISKYPNINELAYATEDDVLKLWQGLGYYSRARNLHAAARHIAFELKGQFPISYISLLKLKGVGDYTASAIASIAYGEVVPTVDGNVLRVISRLFNVSLPVDSPTGKKEIKSLMYQIIDKDNPGDFNQSVMELGARICKPKNPLCQNCPIQEKCLAYEKKNFMDRPVKSKKVKVKKVFIDYLLIQNKSGIVMLQKETKGIWENLFELPKVESSVKLTGLLQLERLRNEYVNSKDEISYVKELKHQLTHRTLHIRFFKCNIDSEIEKNLVEFNDIKSKAVPKPIELFLSENSFWMVD